MTALATTALFLLLQAATPAAPPPQHDHGAMAASSASSESSFAKPIQGNINAVAKEFISVADAMPEDKYSFAPSAGEFKDVRTFGEQVKHVADANLMFAYSVVNNKQAPKEIYKKPTSKAEILAYLRDSFDALDKAAASITPQNATEKIVPAFGKGDMPYGEPSRLGTLILATAHCRDHYGQMIEYQRMNGIIPPPSRK